MIPIILALGLAQLAIVQNQEPPAFFEGGIHEKGGLLKMNDDPKGTKGSNYKEVALTPEGKVYKPQGRNVYANMPKGTEIFKNYKAFDEAMFNNSLDSILNSNSIVNYKSESNYNNVNLEKKLDTLIDTVKTKENFVFNYDGNGAKVFRYKENQRTELLNNEVRFRGVGV
jgi:hypothetical protein